MVNLSPGDKVDVRIKSSLIISPYMDYDEIKTFEIIAKDKYGYYVYVPPYIYLKDTSTVDSYQCKELHIDPKFIGSEFIYISENVICRINSVLDGISCSRCKEFFHMAQANQPDGTLICWSCKMNPYR